jgi:DNA-binding CsgD family transcriptional regulator
VRLAAAGATNASIAASLFVNLKTVESHLTRAYKKLGITDRAELVNVIESCTTVEVLEMGETRPGE